MTELVACKLQVLFLVEDDLENAVFEEVDLVVGHKDLYGQHELAAVVVILNLVQAPHAVRRASIAHRFDDLVDLDLRRPQVDSFVVDCCISARLQAVFF